MGKKEIRRYRRFYGYDYSRGAALFITIVTNPRRRLFGQIVGAKLQKTPLGIAVERRFADMAQMPGIRLFNFVVMPDHVHLQLHLRAGLPNPLVTLGRAIGAFKSLCAKDFHELTGESGALWQQGYHDWICMSEEMLAAVNRYIDYNPLKFELRYNQPEFLAIHEPLAAWRLSTEEFWRGIGAVELLDGGTPFIALRISRKLSARQVAEAVARIRRRVGDYVFVGGWISPGEKAVRDMLLAEPKGGIVQILPSAMPHDYKVGSMWLEAIRDRRAAIIARGNSEIEFSRAACLEVNGAAAGLAAQALPSGQWQGGASAQALPSGQWQGGASAQALPSGQWQGGASAQVLPSREWHGGGSAQGLPSEQGQARNLATQALPSGQRQDGASAQALPPGQGLPCGKAVYWLPEGPKVIS